MKVEILQENFKKALSNCERITRKITSLPVLQNVLIETEGSFIKLITTNLEVSIKWWVLSNVLKQGQVLVPATFFSNLINLINTSKIEFQEENNNLILISKNQEIQIQGQNPEEFPIIPKIEKQFSFKLPGKILEQALSQIVEIPSVSQIRPEISGIYFSFKKGKLKLVATDSFRLAEKTIILDTTEKQEFDFILPQTAAKEILNILSQQEGDIVLHIATNQILFLLFEEVSQSKIELSSRLIEGDYPNYQEIIPKKNTLKITVSKEEFLSQIKKAGLFSGKVQEVKISVFSKEGKIRIFSQSAQAGRSESYITCKTEGKNIETSFNYRFLIDGLNSVKSSEVVFELNSEDSPGVLRPVGDESFLYIIMPIKST